MNAGSSSIVDAAALHARLRQDVNGHPPRVIGITGHLQLNADERRRTDQQLRALQIDWLRPSTPLRLLSGLAPGADLVVTATLLDAAERLDVPVELVALLPGSPERLVDDWLRRCRDLGDPPSPTARAVVEQSLQQLLDRATHVIDLDAITPQPYGESSYRRLAALLACVPDLLVAVFRTDHLGSGGGTAQVLTWRRAPERIPPSLRTLAGSAGRRDLLVIDPRTDTGTPLTAHESATRIRAHLRAGDALSAYDLARATLERQDTDELRYLLLLSLAASGSTHAALEQYEALAPAAGERDEDWLALRARLHKDLAFAGVDANDNLRLAAAEYAAAYARTAGSFSAVNAATLQLLTGNAPAATEFARAALAHATPSDDETGAYFAAVTEAEAHLVLGAFDACRDALARANPLMRDDLTARGRTRRQLARIAAHHGIDARIVETLQMPSVYLLDAGSGPAAAEPPPPDLAQRLSGSPVFAVLEAQQPTLARIAACREAGARINLVLPAPRAQLVTACVEARDTDTASDLGDCIDGAERVSALLGFLPAEQTWNRGEAARLAHGLASVAAGNLGVPLWRLGITADGSWQLGDVAPAAAAEPASQRRMVGLIFTDMVGFRSYSDEDVHAFWSTVMPAFAEDVASIGNAGLLAATWGDAIHVVTNGVQPAASLCLRLIDTVNRLRAGGSGAIGRLRIRVGAHFAPAYVGFDPVERQRTYYGTQLAFAASVEPITPPGMAYVTEAFAAQLALEAPGRYQLEYAGALALAKRYGSFRLHSLRAAPGEAA